MDEWILQAAHRAFRRDNIKASIAEELSPDFGFRDEDRPDPHEVMMQLTAESEARLRERVEHIKRMEDVEAAAFQWLLALNEHLAHYRGMAEEFLLATVLDDHPWRSFAAYAKATNKAFVERAQSGGVFDRSVQSREVLIAGVSMLWGAECTTQRVYDGEREQTPDGQIERLLRLLVRGSGSADRSDVFRDNCWTRSTVSSPCEGSC